MKAALLPDRGVVKVAGDDAVRFLNGLLTTDIAKRLAPPEKGSRILYDHAKGDDPGRVVRGFGLRVTALGVKSFILNYRSAGQERRLTLGGFPNWTVSRARAGPRAAGPGRPR